MNIFIPRDGLSISKTASRREPYGTFNSVRLKGSLSELNTGEAVFFVETSLDGTAQAEYHINLIHLLDKAFLHNSLNLISLRQERFIKLFFKQAGVVDSLLDANDDDPYKDMSSEMQQLDSFLGSYLGVHDGK